MNEVSRVELISKLKSLREEANKGEEFIPEEVSLNASMLDSLIHENYSCTHDYGIKNGNECTCLDCDSSITESSFAKILKAKKGTDIKRIRQKYLEFLLYLSSEKSVNILEEIYGLKLVKPSTSNKN